MKKVLALILALAMVFSLAACGNSNAGTADPDTADPGTAATDTPQVSDSSSLSQSEVDEWPTKPIQLLVPAASGGGMSITASYFLKEFASRTGQTPIMTNNAGLPGYNASLDLEPDNYNFFLGNSTVFTYKALGTLDFGYEAYEPVGILGIAPAFGVWVMSDSGYDTLEDLINAMKEKPGEIVIGNKTGTFKHLYSALMLDTLGVKANLVEFGDDAACIAALLGGNCEVYIGSYSGSATQYADDGTIKCLAVADTERVDATPDVPTFIECGYEFTFPYQMTTLVAPKGTDPAILDKMNAMIVDVSNTEQYKEDMAALGSEPCPWDRATVAEYFEQCQKQIDEAAKLLSVS